MDYSEKKLLDRDPWGIEEKLKEPATTEPIFGKIFNKIKASLKKIIKNKKQS